MCWREKKYSIEYFRNILWDIYMSISYQYISFMCDVFNKCVCINVFPSSMKLAEISPIYKKDNLCKENYRSVNLLIMVSKVFERILADQLTAYFENLLSSCLSAYRKGYNCQHVILRLTEYWRQALDGGNFVGTVAMDLSKAFDRMPHGLLIAKLHAYGLSINACQLIISYLRDRRQRVKVMGECRIGRPLIVVYLRALWWVHFCLIYFLMTYSMWKWTVKLLIMLMIIISTTRTTAI